MRASLDRTPTDEVRTQAPAAVVPRPRSSPEGHSQSSSPRDAVTGAADPGPPRTTGFSTSVVAVLAIVCLLLAVVVSYLGVALWEFSQSSPLSGLFPT
jgi:hypothetical protein